MQHQQGRRALASVKTPQALSSAVESQVTKRKGEIREFSGWTFEAATKEWERAQEYLGRFKGDALNGLLDILELPRGSGVDGHKVRHAANEGLCGTPYSHKARQGPIVPNPNDVEVYHMSREKHARCVMPPLTSTRRYSCIVSKHIISDWRYNGSRVSLDLEFSPLP